MVSEHHLDKSTIQMLRQERSLYIEIFTNKNKTL